MEPTNGESFPIESKPISPTTAVFVDSETFGEFSISEATATTTAATITTLKIDSKKNWYKNALDHVEDAVHKVVPEKLRENKQLAHAFDKLDEHVKMTNTDKIRYPELDWDATVRISQDICDEEKKFVLERKEFMREKFAKYIDVDIDEIDIRDIPIIAFGGSGGGFRAMIATTGYLRAAQDSGVWDLGTYFSGVSGSCWNIGAQYTSVIADTENPLQELIDHFKKRLNVPVYHPHALLKTLTRTNSPETAVELVFGGLAQKKLLNLKCRIIDVFGSLLASRLLLGEESTNQYQDFKLSAQKRFLAGGKNPMPIYTTIHHFRPWKHSLTFEEAATLLDAKKILEEHEKKTDHFQWFEFTPFEIGCDEYPAWVPTWAFGRRFEAGKSLERLPERNFSLLFGVFGSAPAAPLSKDIEQFELFLPEGWLKRTWTNLYAEVFDKAGKEKKLRFEGHQIIPQSTDRNFIYHLHPPPYTPGVHTLPLIDFVDAGASNDLPLYPFTHLGRKIDIIIGIDSSSQTIDHKYFEGEQKLFTLRRGLKRVRREGIPESKYIEVYDYIPTNKTDNDYTPAANHESTLIYMPFLPNEKVDKDFVPSTEKFTRFNNFVYTPDQIDLVVKLARQNWNEGEQIVKSVIKSCWEKKKAARLSGNNS
ncbi:3856_t:CDS:2 [Ambispora gerdemannii]|uniref:Lysophospholipase n=1 Tax=Ambispora gerdemannii TaxID=144530 RepID=A0A9N8W7D2_9GLOM|nr:3856_t:CDS:2 [Ambispora gerdemannii]